MFEVFVEKKKRIEIMLTLLLKRLLLKMLFPKIYPLKVLILIFIAERKYIGFNH